MELKKILLAAAVTTAMIHSAKAQSTIASNVLSGTQTSPTEFLGSSNTMDVVFKSNNAERMRINAGGYVSVGGIFSPSRVLHVQTTQTNGGIRVTQTALGFSSLELYNSTTGGHNWAMVSTGNGNGEGAGHLGFYDYTNGGYRLFINGSNGNVGIGTYPPLALARLHVNGWGLFTNNSWGSPTSAATIRANSNYSTATNPDYTWWNNDQTGFFHPAANVIAFSAAGLETMRITGSGNVAIGTTSPGTNKLAVEGRIAARDILVTNVNPFPDYVFENTYPLMKLPELENYLIENKHLPHIPSAEEVKQNNGVELGKMQSLQLEKIEEIFLHLIELNKKIEQLENENSQLKAELHK